MSKENQEKLSLWKSWLIKKLISNDSSKEEILNFITSEEKSDNELKTSDDNNEKSLIKNIFQLENKSVEDVMVPRGEIISVDNKQNYDQILELIKTESHSRLPVYENNLDDIIGFFHVKDFIKINKKNFDLNSILRESLYVAPKSPILELLNRMRLSRIHIALVVDGIGGVDGLVTIEDLVEEIVGEIEDEHDGEHIDELIISKSNNSIVVDAEYKIEELEKYFNISINNEENHEIDTLGGLIFSKINRVPKNNEVIEIDNLINIKIIKASERKILTIEVKNVG